METYRQLRDAPGVIGLCLRLPNALEWAKTEAMHGGRKIPAPIFWAVLAWLVTIPVVVMAAGESAPLRARDLGIPLRGVPGRWNAITDVPGVCVGHATLIRGSGPLVVGEGPVRTGVTAVLPAGPAYRPVFAAWASLNGNGEMTGTHWIEESGWLEEPILLTNTHSVGVAHQASIEWRRRVGFYPPEAGHAWAALPVVAETWDGRLNDIHGDHVKPEHVIKALNRATTGPVREGNVGGGTGMVCHRFKGGIGTSSRQVNSDYTLGVLVQANYGRREDLRVAGVPVGLELPDLMPEIHSLGPGGQGSSVIVILATDAPLLPHQLKRLARRATLGVGRTGGLGNNSSGDFFLAFSTAPVPRSEADGLLRPRMLPNDQMDPYFQAAVEATEEAVLNALVAAETMTGINGNTVYALPHDRLREILRKYHRLIEAPANEVRP